MNNISYLTKEQCCGCAVCTEFCPQKAISEAYDSEGFLYPKVNLKKCINCGICVKHCPQLNIIKPDRNTLMREFIAYANNKSEVEKSASGAVAVALYKTVIETGGYVVGVRWSEKMDGSAEYILTNSIDGIECFRGSKYVQAEKRDIYRKIEEIVNTDRNILIVGLPCEIAAFKRYFYDKNKNIYYCDLICYGPTSTSFFKDYLSELKIKYHDLITNISMRHKINQKERPYLKVEFSKGSNFLKPFYQTDIGLAFTIFGRKNCSSCKYNFLNSVADVSLGDCVGQNSNDFYNETGLSRVLIRTPQGEQLFNALKDISCLETNGKSEIFFSERKCRQNNNTRESFSNNYLSKGYKYAIKIKFGVIRRLINEFRCREK